MSLRTVWLASFGLCLIASGSWALQIEPPVSQPAVDEAVAQAAAQPPEKYFSLRDRTAEEVRRGCAVATEASATILSLVPTDTAGRPRPIGPAAPYVGPVATRPIYVLYLWNERTWRGRSPPRVVSALKMLTNPQSVLDCPEFARRARGSFDPLKAEDLRDADPGKSARRSVIQVDLPSASPDGAHAIVGLKGQTDEGRMINFDVYLSKVDGRWVEAGRSVD